MRILLVEDNVGVAADLVKSITKQGDCDVVWAKSLKAALRQLSENDFDLLILDRSIPTDDNVLDDDIAHGWAVFQYAAAHYPGLPIWFLTATEDPDFAVEIGNSYARQADLHGLGQPQAMIKVIWKKNLLDVVDYARAFTEHTLTIQKIHLVSTEGHNLSPHEEKNIKLFSRLHKSSSVEIKRLGGGLSGARVLKVTAKNQAGQPLLQCVAKIANFDDANDELRRYRAHVVRLIADGFPSLTAEVSVGSGNISGLYYGLVPGDVSSVFNLIGMHPGKAAAVPGELRRIFQPWESDRQKQRVSVGEIRRRLVPDPKMEQLVSELPDIDIRAVEAITVDAYRAVQHNDLHGENVISYGGDKIMIIDYNDVGPSFAGLDAITLSLSTIFHQSTSQLRQTWPTVEKMDNWCNLEAYVDGCPYREFVAECRKWAIDSSGSPAAASALAYAYGIRQLKYTDTDKPLARALIGAASRHLLS